VCIPSPLDSEPRLSLSVSGVLPTVGRVETRVKANAGTADRRSCVFRVAALAMPRQGRRRESAPTAPRRRRTGARSGGSPHSHRAIARCGRGLATRLGPCLAA
jgi:hypothetical protein